MQKLHLVGVTTDHQGLILSARRGTRSGGYTLGVDDGLAEVVEDVLKRQAEADAGDDASAADGVERTPRVESQLSVREIQARLRRGRSVAEVARAAGVEPSWIERFAVPVFAERARVIERVRAAALRRARLGPSALPVGTAVARNVADRGVTMSPDEADAAWRAHQLADGRWAVRFAFRHRGREQVLRFDLDEQTGEVTAADRASAQLGFVAPPASAAPQRRAGDRSQRRPTVKRATVSSGFRADGPPSKGSSGPAKERERAASAMAKATAKRVAEAERAVARREREKRRQAAREERERAARERAEAAAEKERERAAARERDERERARAAAKAAKAAKAVKATKSSKKAGKASTAKTSRPAQATKARQAKAANRVQTSTRSTKATKAPKARSTKTTAARAATATAVRAAATPAVTRPAPQSATTTPTSPDGPAAPSARGQSDGSPRIVTSPNPGSTPAPPMPTGGAPPRERPAPPRFSGPASDVYGPAAARALFRAGLVEQATGDADRRGPDAEEPSPNGAISSRTPTADRPRRTRPLRAT